jgi:transcription initiation factor TFIIB
LSFDINAYSSRLVLGDRIVDTRSEWRTFSNDEAGDDPSRIGAVRNVLLNGSQLDTIIAANSAASASLARVQGKSAQAKGEQSLVNAYKDISAMCEAISLPRSIQDIAKHLYKRVDDNKALKGRSNESIIAACIFIACRQGGVPRTIKEICTLTTVGKKDLGKAFKALEKILQTEGASASATGPDGYRPTKATSAAELMIRFCNKLGLPQKVVSACQDLAMRAQKAGTLDGRSPISIAAAGIYLISNVYGIQKTPKQIAEIAGVSDSTIRTSYRYLYNARHQLIDPSWHPGKSLDDLLPSAK